MGIIRGEIGLLKMKELLKKQLAEAIATAGYFHKEQRDRNNEIYIMHPLRIMFQMESYEEKIVAILHDVVEDTECSMEYLAEKVSSAEIVQALEAISRRENEEYFVYIHRVKQNSLAKSVKIKDLMDNLSRKGASVSLRHRYYKALEILCANSELPKNIERIAEFYGVEVYIDRLLPEVEYLEVNYQDEVVLKFSLEKEQLLELGEYAFVERIFMMWFREHRHQLLRMIENMEYYLLPEWEL